LAKLGVPVGAAGAFATLRGFGGANKIGELIWNRFISG